MDLRLTEEQEAFAASVRAFAREHVEPTVLERDRAGRWDPDVWARVAGFGLAGLPVPEAYGGSGADVLTTGLALEALAHGGRDAGLNLSLGAHLTIGCMPIVLHGTEEQRQRWLPRMARGESIGAFAITEPEAGSDTASMRTSARREGDVFVLDGTKTFVTNGGLADVVTVVARTDPDAPASQAFTAFLVETGWAGFEVSRELHKLGNRTSPTVELSFAGVEVPEAAVLGEPGTALWKVGFECFDWERCCMIASAVGGMHRDLDECVRYAREREAFGKPIGDFGAIQHKLAQMRIRLENARFLQRQAAWRKDAGEEHQLEASMAKAYVGEAAVASALDAVQLHGGWGYVDEFHVERSLRDAKLAAIGGGTTEIQELLIARQLLG
ncbi:acyl-CoA dehydrogenase family protein [Egicoccus halophilus]|uniref:Acyl-CoA dehydrogenase n=1 Tax=Egicoccus halophilus TaxID=1670830 RepID=A0A8J3EUF6_9ACTN|nr:acyl-CoA dehydrogenase family protein [Egicoccus halophilus]GGI07606.1 acyl-CoA dehydrogenase [Egicoccus halophilus]